MQDVLKLLSSIHPLPPELFHFLMLNLKKQMVRKKQILLKPGQVCSRIYFIESGLFRGYKQINGVVKRSIWFMKEGDCMVCVNSWFTQTPSEQGIEAIEEGLVHYITYDELEYIYHHFPSFERNGRLLVQKYYLLTEPDKDRLMMVTALERYNDYQRNWPEMAERIPGIYLASFLGMSVETFYKIRNKGNEHDRR